MKRARTATLLLPLLILLVGCGGGASGGGSVSANPSTSGGVQGTGGPLSITTTSLPDGFAGKPYVAAIDVAGGNGRLTWSTAPGSFFPGGLKLDSATGNISGTVSSAVWGDVTFRVTDSGSPQQMAEKILRMTFRWPLSVTSVTPIPVAHTGVPYKLPLYAGGVIGNVSWTISKGQLPPGLNLTNTSSTEADLVGTPTQTGSFSFTAQATDSYNPPQVAALDVTIVVDNKLAIATQQLATAYAGVPYTQAMVAVNGTPPYHWSAQLPYGLSIDANTGVISGTPGGGNYTATITVTDSASPPNTASQMYNMLILAKLQLPAATLPDAHLSEPYSTTLYAVGGSGMLAFSILSGTLPPGISLLSQFGALGGIPTQLGTFTFTVQVVDSSSPPQSAQNQYTITTKPSTLTVQPSVPSRAPINVPFDAVVAVTGGTPPYTWAVSSGGLPPGLSLNTSTGEINGTPTTAGYFVFGVKVTDSSPTAQNAFNGYGITVGPALGRNDTIATATTLGNGSFLASISLINDPPASGTLSPDTDYYRIRGTAGAVVKVEIFASRYNSANPLDSVLEFVDANGVRLNACRLPGDTTSNFNTPCIDDDITKGVNHDSELELQVPGAAGIQTVFYAHVLDWRGDARPDMTYSIQVSGAVDPLAITTTSLPGVKVGGAYSAQLASSGGTGTVTWAISAGSLPVGITMSPTGLFSGSCATAGTYNFTVTATDSGSPAQQATATFSIIVGVPPLITTTSFPDGYTGVPYGPVPLTFTGGTPPFCYTFNPSPGLTIGIDQAGNMHGTPYYAGTYSFWAGVSDALGLWDSRQFTIVIHPGPLSVPATTTATAQVGVTSWFWITPNGGTPNFTCSVVSGSLPPGMSFVLSPLGCEVMGTPTTAGTFTATFTVSDSAQPPQTATGNVTVTVSP